jgi:Domain of unknown function (DUF4386)
VSICSTRPQRFIDTLKGETTMTTAVLTEWAPEPSPRSTARIAGVFYLLCVVTGIFAIFATAGRIVEGDAAKTAAGILAHETLYRAGIAAGFIAAAAYIAVAVLLYHLLKPVSRTLARASVLFNVLGCAVGSVSTVCALAPFVLLGKPHLGAFSPEQLQALTYAFLKFGDEATYVSLIFFGFYMLVIGYLIFKSTFLPRILGILVAAAGLSYLTYLWAPFAQSLQPFSMLPVMLGELGLTGWLLAGGVNAQRWSEVERAAATRRA